MTDFESGGSSPESTFGWKTTLLLCVLIISVGLGLLWLIFTSEPRPTRSAGTRTTPMLVDVIRPDSGTYRPRIHASGTVIPAREIILRPRVEGKIVKTNRNFTPGGFVQEGDTLIQVDPSDYKNILQQRKNTLAEAKAELEIEQGNQAVAEYEYEAIGEQIQGENKSLVLREPQLKIAKSTVRRAQEDVEQAQLNLNRTTIEAPFNAHVLDRNVNVGSQVSPGDNLARLVGYDTYWVEATVPLSKLRRLSMPDTPGNPGSTVQIRNTSSWPDGVQRTGRVYKLIGELEDNTRMARLLVTVSDPLSRTDTSGDSPLMITGSFVEVSIEGKSIANVIRLNREYVRDDETIWVMKDGELDIRNVEIVFQDDQYAYIRDGVKANDRIVTTNLSTVVDGAPLRPKSSRSTDQTNGDTTLSLAPLSDQQRRNMQGDPFN